MEMLRSAQLVSAKLATRHERRVVHDERRRHGGVEPGAVQHHAQAGGHASAGGRDGARADAGHVRHPGHAGLRHQSAEHPHRRPRHEDARTSTRCAARTSRSCTIRASRLIDALQDNPMLSGVTSDLLNRSPIVRVHIDRAAGAVARRHAARASSRRWRTRTTSSRCRRSSCRRTSTTVVMETVPSAQVDASALEHFFVPAPAGGRFRSPTSRRSR